jgi:hypothetical protein
VLLKSTAKLKFILPPPPVYLGRTGVRAAAGVARAARARVWFHVRRWGPRLCVS